MRNVVIYYKDAYDNYREEYRAGPYPGDKAKIVKENLEMMGCNNFRVEPTDEKIRKVS